MAMTYTGNADLFIAAQLNQAIHQNLVDATDLRNLCTGFGDVFATGSLASKISKVTWDDAMAAANADEVTAPSATDLTNSSVTLTAARQVLRRDITDLYSLAGGNRLGIDAFAAQMSMAAQLRFTDMITALFTNIATVEGDTGTNLTVDDVLAGQYALIQNRVPGPHYAVLAPIQLTDFLDSLRGEGGSVQFDTDTNQMQQMQQAGFGRWGNWHGIEFWSCDSVVTNGADKEGAMFGAGAFGYVEGVPLNVRNVAGPGSFASVTPNGAPLFVEFERKAAEANTLVVGNYYVGVGEVEDLRAVQILSSAT